MLAHTGLCKVVRVIHMSIAYFDPQPLLHRQQVHSIGGFAGGFAEHQG